MLLTDEVRKIKGVGEKTEKALLKLDIRTVKDLLWHLPVYYKDFREVSAIADVGYGEYGLFCVTVSSQAKTVRLRGSLTKTTFFVTDDSACAEVVIFNQIHIKRYISEGSSIYIYGKLMHRSSGCAEISSPQIYFKKPDDLLPVYSLCMGISQHLLRKLVLRALEDVDIAEPYSKEFMIENALLPLRKSLELLHMPKDAELLKSARQRLVFDEFLLYNCMLFEDGDNDAVKSNLKFEKNGIVEEFSAKLPFRLTNAQKRVINDINKDLTSSRYMNRLVQGDVGSGKTVVAFFAMYAASASGYQSVLMAPTEILARQHYQAAKKYFREEDILLVTAALTQKEKKDAYERIKDGSAKVIIGTHALVYGDIEYRSLALVITDEQHKFGVRQRARLACGNDVHTLIMSATPIPRSLTLVLYGKADVSVIDELPPGRQKIKTYIVPEKKYDDMLGFFEKHIRLGSRVYVVCPLIEENELFSSRSVKKVYEQIKKRFSSYNVGMLHGQMKNNEKESIMRSFADGDIDILVTTTVIEVGVDVPAATVMCVLDAEHYGLAQLHQIRGRVGRGKNESFCFFVSDNTKARERLDVLVKSSDGFEIAKKDMEMRGSGDMLGTRQHGEASFRIADLIEDLPVLEKTRRIAEDMRKNDGLRAEYEKLLCMAKEKFKDEFKDIVFN